MESRENLEDTTFMEAALEEARRCLPLGEVPVGAVVVQHGRVLAGAGNRRETLQDPTAHAEVLAIQAAARALGSWRLEGCTLYVTLEPCAMCAGAIILARIPRCVFGARDPKGGFVGTVGDLSSVPALNHRFAVMGGVGESASAELLRSFFQSLRRQESPSRADDRG